jgi:hypothetical protein
LHRSLPCLLLRVQYLLRRHLRKLLLRQSLLHPLSPHLELLLRRHLLSPLFPQLLLLREPEWSLQLVAGISLW